MSRPKKGYWSITARADRAAQAHAKRAQHVEKAKASYYHFPKYKTENVERYLDQYYLNQMENGRRVGDLGRRAVSMGDPVEV